MYYESILEERVGQYWTRWGRWVVLVLAVLMGAAILGALIYRLYTVSWIGFGEFSGSVAQADRAKTLWDWMDLLLVPLVLAIAAAVFVWQADKRERTRSADATLRAYINRMTDLIEKGLRESGPGDLCRSIAWAQTLTAVRQLDGDRKGLLLQFLNESGLIGSGVGMRNYDGSMEERKAAVVNLTMADLREANLGGAYLIGVDLNSAWLERADLRGANLWAADLRGASLDDADLRMTNLRRADLRSADLSRVDLSQTSLDGADLRKADLRRAKVSDLHLAHAKTIKGAIMPDEPFDFGGFDTEILMPEPEDPDRPSDPNAGGGDQEVSE